MTVHQWDIVKVRIQPGDKDEHPAVVLSREEWCQDDRRRVLNVMYCTSARPGLSAGLCDVVLNGADGLERKTLVSCEHVHTVPRAAITATIGRVGVERRRQIGRTIVQAFRLPL